MNFHFHFQNLAYYWCVITTWKNSRIIQNKIILIPKSHPFGWKSRSESFTNLPMIYILSLLHCLEFCILDSVSFITLTQKLNKYIFSLLKLLASHLYFITVCNPFRYTSCSCFSCTVYMNARVSPSRKITYIYYKYNLQCLTSFPPDAASKLNILWHNSDTLGLNGTQVTVFKESN